MSWRAELLATYAVAARNMVMGVRNVFFFFELLFWPIVGVLSIGLMTRFLGLTPDLATYGKILGGGLAVGAFCGRKDLMDLVAPVGKVYQAGTLSANPLAMRTGLATLKKLCGENGDNSNNIYVVVPGVVALPDADTQAALFPVQ